MESKNEAVAYSYLIRERDTLAIYCDFHPVLEDLDFHVLSLGLEYDPLTRQLLQDGLTALGLHLASRPIDEHVGWTINIQEPLVNLFFTGDSRKGTLVGRAYTEGVDTRGENVFVSQSKRDRGDTQMSSVPVSGFDIFAMVETYYKRSEQKLGRFFHKENVAAFLQALPGVDEDWLGAVEADEVFELVASGNLHPLASRTFRFRCGCDIKKITDVLVGIYGKTPEVLFCGDPAVEAECPRCASKINISLEDYMRQLTAR